MRKKGNRMVVIITLAAFLFVAFLLMWLRFREGRANLFWKFLASGQAFSRAYNPPGEYCHRTFESISLNLRDINRFFSTLLKHEFEEVEGIVGLSISTGENLARSVDGYEIDYLVREDKGYRVVEFHVCHPIPRSVVKVSERYDVEGLQVPFLDFAQQESDPESILRVMERKTGESLNRSGLRMQYVLDQRGKRYWIEYEEGVRFVAYSVESNVVLDEAEVREANLVLARPPDYIADRARAVPVQRE